MITDRQGNPLSGATPASAALFDQAVEAFNLYRGDPFALLEAALEATPEFVMARIAKIHLLALATEPEATATARKQFSKLKTMKLTDREASHATALQALLAGEWTETTIRLDRHNADYPRDLLALQCGHLVDFYRANGRNLRDRIARALPEWTSDLPGYAVLLGMYAFGLEETGDYDRAEETGRRALALQPLDCWAHHAVAHAMEMQGRPEDGIGWMTARERHWSGDDNFFKVHNWWHLCLFHLDLGQTDLALGLYDSAIRLGNSTMALDLVDASALLWRLHLLGIDVGDRWNEVATAWANHADGSTYPFNDWHAVMACLGAGRDSEAQDLMEKLQRTSEEQTETADWVRRNALPLAQGFIAFWQGDYRTAVEHLYSARYIANSFGGSQAQRDIIDLTLAEAAIRGNLRGLARALVNERLALKPRSGGNRILFSRCGDKATATIKAA